jgi:hypothetical protein
MPVFPQKSAWRISRGTTRYAIPDFEVSRLEMRDIPRQHHTHIPFSRPRKAGCLHGVDNADSHTHIGDRIDDPIRSLADAILIFVAGEFFTTGRSRIGGMILNALDDAETILLGS